MPETLLSRKIAAAALALLAGLIVFGAASLLFTTFMVYDDEGYVLFSLQEFAAIGGLYEKVYSQYGPFFFLFHQALHLAGMEFTNTGARLLTLACWLATVGFSAGMVWRASRSSAATMLAAGGVFLHLWPMSNEPSHPGGFIAAVVAGIAWLGSRWFDRPARLAAATGLAAAALLLTKINIGIFLVAGAGAWWALHLDEHRLGLRVRATAVGLAMAFLPCALMWSRLELPWVATFTLLAAAAGTATVLAAARGATGLTSWRDPLVSGGAAAGLGAITCLAVAAQGTSFAALLDGVILGPLRHPAAYTAYVRWRIGVAPLALASLGLAIWVILRPSATSVRVVALGRLLVAGLFFAGLLFGWPLNSHAFALSYALGATWLFAYPLGPDRDSQPLRSWLALLVVTQALHAYPVAGSQISWGTFLWIPLAVIGTREAWAVLAPPPLSTARVWRIAALAVMLTSLGRSGQAAWLGLTRLREGDAPGLPGTAGMRLPENLTTALRTLARNVSAHADVVFSLPGMHSFHLWTEVPPPTTVNATHWFTLLSASQQEAIRIRLEESPRSVVVVQRYVYDFLIQSGFAVDTPLSRWLHANYEPAFSLQSYEFWVRKGRRIAGLGTATAHEAIAGVTPRFQFSLILAEPDLRDVTSVELARFEGDVSTPMQIWQTGDAQLFLTPLSSTGDPAGPSRQVEFPFTAAGLQRLELRTDKVPAAMPGDLVFYLRGANGGKLAEARLVQEVTGNR